MSGPRVANLALTADEARVVHAALLYYADTMFGDEPDFEERLLQRLAERIRERLRKSVSRHGYEFRV